MAPGATVTSANTSHWSHPGVWSKNRATAESDFDAEYRRQLRQLDPRRVVADLLAGQADAILLCWEEPGRYCHRRIAAVWLETELGIQVPEVAAGGYV
jgi:hypothetical protein